MIYRLLTIAACLHLTTFVNADDLLLQLTASEEQQRDTTHWKRLLAERNFAELERISDELRSDPQKYCNGRGRDWKFYWTPMKSRESMTEEDYRLAFEAVEEWLEEYPDSVSARLMLAHLYHRYSFFARGGAFASDTKQSQLDVFEERNRIAKKFLVEIAKSPENVCNVHRRLQVEISKGLGRKPDRQLVYDALESDPLNVELVHGMAICLLPRWYGAPGELEEFAEDVALRTKEKCGAFHYLIAVMAAKEFLKEYVLLEHDFDIERIRQGVDDALRLYPRGNEYYDEAAQLLYLSGDVDGAIDAFARIEDHPSLNRWEYAEIRFPDFRQRVRQEYMSGDHNRLIAGSTSRYVNMELDVNETFLTAVDAEGGIRVFDFKTGHAEGWTYLQGIKPWTTSIQRQRQLILAGVYNRNEAHLYTGGVGGARLPTFKGVEATCFSRDGQLCAVADAQGFITLYFLQEDVEPVRYPPNRLRHLVAMQFSPDGNELIATTRYGKIVFITLSKEVDEAQETVTVWSRGLSGLACSESHVAVGGWRGTILILDRKTHAVEYEWTPEVQAQVRSLAFNPEGTALAIGRSVEKKHNEPVVMPLSIWRFESEESPRELKGHRLGVLSVRFANSGKTLVSAGNDWTIRYWDVE